MSTRIRIAIAALAGFVGTAFAMPGDMTKPMGANAAACAEHMKQHHAAGAQPTGGMQGMPCMAGMQDMMKSMHGPEHEQMHAKMHAQMHGQCQTAGKTPEPMHGHMRGQMPGHMTGHMTGHMQAPMMRGTAPDATGAPRAP